MNLWQSLTGMVRVEVTSADIQKTLEELTGQGISIYHLEQTDLLTAEFTISRPDLKTVSAYCENRGNSLRLRGKAGLWWQGEALWKRPVLLAGLLLLLLVAAYLPTRVFFFSVEGNSALADNRILEAAESCGIRFGVSRQSIRSEKMKNALLAALPELQWAGINTYGCRGVISVRERAQAAQPERASGITSIVAARDGIITSCTVTRGNGVCTVGQPVKKDQLLISPYVDCGLCIKVVAPEGEVFGETNRKIRALIPENHTDVRENGDAEKRYSLILGKKRINFWKGSGISGATCGRMYEEYYITLPGGFRLPVCLAVETILYRTIVPDVLSESDAQAMLQPFSAACVSDRMIAGSILSQNHAIEKAEGIWVLERSYVCNEMIGRIQAERNGE